MKGLFSYDGPVMGFITGFAELVILNILTLLLCLPIVTAGASITAMHYVCLKLIRREGSSVAKMFFKSFKENIKPGIILWLPMLVILLATSYDVWLIIYGSINVYIGVQVVIGAGLVFVLLVTAWVFPLLCHFAYPRNIDYYRNSFILSFSRFPRTLLIALLTLSPFAFMYMAGNRSIAWLVILGFSGPGILKAAIYNTPFKALEPKEEEEEDNEQSTALDDAKKEAAAGTASENEME